MPALSRPADSIPKHLPAIRLLVDFDGRSKRSASCQSPITQRELPLLQLHAHQPVPRLHRHSHRLYEPQVDTSTITVSLILYY